MVMQKFDLVPRLIDDVHLDRSRRADHVESALDVLLRDEDMLRRHKLEHVLREFIDMKVYVRFRFRDLRPREPSELGGRYRHLLRDIREDYAKLLNLSEELYNRYPNIWEMCNQFYDLLERHYKHLETEEGLYNHLVDIIKPMYNLNNPPEYPEVVNKFLRSIVFDLYFWGALEGFWDRFDLLGADREHVGHVDSESSSTVVARTDALLELLLQLKQTILSHSTHGV